MKISHVLYSGIMVGHVTPEAYDGGPIALVQNGDKITIDIQHRALDLVSHTHTHTHTHSSNEHTHIHSYSFQIQELSPGEVERRKKEWTMPSRPVVGVLGKYRRAVSSAHTGAVTH